MKKSMIKLSLDLSKISKKFLRKFVKGFCLVLPFFAFSNIKASSNIDLSSNVWDTYSDTWVATDDLGRVLPTAGKGAKLPRENKTVGVFYYIWHGNHPMAADSPYVIPEIVKQSNNDSKRQWGPLGAFHHWGKPLYDFYVADDEWVIRKNAQLLSDAGVDVIIFDTTNSLPYTDTYMRLLEVYSQIRKEGKKTPQVAFNLGIKDTQIRVLESVYEDLYTKGIYEDLIFKWKGKPLILANFNVPEVAKYQDYFSMRFSWAWSRQKQWFKDGEDRWFWLDDTPQKYGWHKNPRRAEYVSVSSAQHPHTNKGKSYHNGKSHYPASPEKGLYFQEQWDSALKTDPEFINITQWNEWVAQRFINSTDPKKSRHGFHSPFAGKKAKEGDSLFIDVFDEEYNRDVEPMSGGWGDNYYYQMIAGIRKFKGVRDIPIASGLKSIKTFADFDNVLPEYRDDKYDTFNRDHKGWGKYKRLQNDTGRNDIIISKVARDIDHWFFYVETMDKLTKVEGENWMELFISDDKRNKNAYTWNGYNLRFAPSLRNPKKYNVYSYTKEGSWEKIFETDFIIDENKIIICLPRRGLSESFQFKWWDNRQTDNIVDAIIHGDTAPNARFNYQYKTK